MPALSESTRKIIKATAPVLAEHGPLITSTMYKNMFPKHPEVKTLFNQVHQIVPKGEKFAPQPRSLAQAVHAYAANIDNLEALGSAIERIAEKHVSTLVKGPHYAIVGTELIGALKEVLGDAATPDIVQAWTEGYQFLADVFIKREKEISDERAAMEGGWEDLREFTIAKKESVATDIASFTLKPKDGGSLLKNWKAGHYIGIRHAVNGVESQRNYSVSNSCGEGAIRLTIKRESENIPHGIISNALHELKEGDSVRITVPCGHFFMKKPADDKPVVLLGLGVGVTPIYPMAAEAVKYPNDVVVIQGARNEDYLPLGDDFIQLKEANSEKMSYEQLFKTPLKAENRAQTMSFDNIWSKVPQDATFYFSGPGGWMEEVARGLHSKGVDTSKINYEFFGPTISL